MHISLAFLSAVLAASATNPVEIRVLNKDDRTPIPKAKVLVLDSIDKDAKLIDAFDATDDQGRVFSKKLASGKWSTVFVLVAVPPELVPPGKKADARVFQASVTPKIQILMPIAKFAKIWIWDELSGSLVQRTVQMRKEHYQVMRAVREVRTIEVVYYDPITGERRIRSVPYTVCRSVAETAERWVPVLGPHERIAKQEAPGQYEFCSSPEVCDPCWPCGGYPCFSSPCCCPPCPIPCEPCVAW